MAILFTPVINEYASVKERTAPAIVLQRFDSPNLSPPALSDGQVVQYSILQTDSLIFTNFKF